MERTEDLVRKHRWVAFKIKFGYFLEALGATKDYTMGDIVSYNNKKCYIIEKNKSLYTLSEFRSLKIYKNVYETDFFSLYFFKNFMNRLLSHYKWRRSYCFYMHLQQEIAKLRGKHGF